MKFEPVVKKNDELNLEIIDLTYEGRGVAKVDGYPIFIEDALTGETVRTRIIKVNKQYAFGKVIQIIKPSADRVEVVNRQYTQTGIAPLQHLAYPAQLTFKQKQIENLYQKLHLEIDVLPTLGMSDPTGYRNKAQIPVRDVNGVLETGFYRKHSHQLVPMTDFYIQDPKIDEAIVIVRDLLRKYHIEAYDETNHTGVVRNILVRRGHTSHELMIVLVTRAKKLPLQKEIITDLKQALPELVSLVQNVNAKQTNVVLGDVTKTLYGKDYLTDELLGLKFRISPASFYQVNPVQTEVLYQKAIEAAKLTGDENVIDAYSGIGTISLAMAKHAKHVYGVEIVAQAVSDARVNAEINHINNVTFEIGKAEQVIQKWQADGLSVDVLMVDPPRKGLDEQFVNGVGEIKPKRIVYVSCNPATLARDIQRFEAFGYSAKQTQPVDMFPMTPHIESVTALTLDK